MAVRVHKMQRYSERYAKTESFSKVFLGITINDWLKLCTFFLNIEYGKMIPKLRASNITVHEINLVTSRLYANYCMVQTFSLAAVLTT